VRKENTPARESRLVGKGRDADKRKKNPLRLTRGTLCWETLHERREGTWKQKTTATYFSNPKREGVAPRFNESGERVGEKGFDKRK